MQAIEINQIAIDLKYVAMGHQHIHSALFKFIYLIRTNNNWISQLAVTISFETLIYKLQFNLDT